MNPHHDAAHLIQLSGGNATFVARLNKMMEEGVYDGNDSFNNTILNPGNEPSFTTPYLYHYAGRQDLSVERSRFIAKEYYNAGTGGIPGNSDAGAMQTWLLWNMYVYVGFSIPMKLLE